LLERIRYGVLLGSQEWTAKMRVLLSGDEREQRALEVARKEGVAFEDITASIAHEFGEPWEDLKNRRGNIRGHISTYDITPCVFGEYTVAVEEWRRRAPGRLSWSDGGPRFFICKFEFGACVRGQVLRFFLLFE